MLRNPKLLKAITAFLILETLFNTVAPTISWALTAGPTAPEFSSFEPVDTTDMVNLFTGDMTYNLPLLEVPGPSGGYPLSLSYHSGIKVDQEASWVGLGWTLNPGAINRDINGFADDNQKVRHEVRDYWDGGESTTKTYSIGLSAPNGGLGVSYTRAVTNDVYKGFSSHSGFGLSWSSPGQGAKITPSMQFSSDGVAMGLSYSPGGDLPGTFFRGVNTSVGISISSNSIRTSLGLTQRGAPQPGAAAIASFTRKVSDRSAAMPFGNYSVKKYYTRYWSDQADAMYSYGSLYSKDGDDQGDQYYNYVDHVGQDDLDYGNQEFRSYSNDIYDLYEKQDGTRDRENHDHANSAFQAGGTFPANDQFVVTAQGLNGSIEPYNFDNGNMKGQNAYARSRNDGGPYMGSATLEYKALKKFGNKRVDFRFKNDFSNSLTIDNSTIDADLGIWHTDEHDATADVYGYNGNDEGSTKQMLAGSKHIEWFTNDDIVDGSARSKGFIDCYEVASDRPLEKEMYKDYLQPEACDAHSQSWGDHYRGAPGSGIYIHNQYPNRSEEEIVFNRKYNSLKPYTVSLESRIGGFMITNESGVTYHYALPAYSYNEYTQMRVKRPLKEAATIKEIRNDEPYAYTWLLTAITGPDYVDRGGEDGVGNGILDDDDFGYWVKFDYGLWTDSYQWRTPFSGYTTDVESEYESFSYGMKELYYLDAIETKSHKAFFVKSKRQDGRGTTSRKEGGVQPRQFTMRYNWDNSYARLKYSVSPVSSLKLDAIYMFDKKDLEGINVNKAGGDVYDDFPIANPKMYPYTGTQYVYKYPKVYNSNNQAFERTVTITQGEDFVKVKYHNGDLVLDYEDIDALNDQLFKEKALRTIKLNTDYSLAQNVSNSIAFYSAKNSPCNASGGSCNPTQGAEDRKLDFEWPTKYDAEKCNGTVNSWWFDTQPPRCCNESDRKQFYSDWPLFWYLDMCDVENPNDFLGRLEVQYGKTGKLTLKEVQVIGKSGVALMPPTKFAYGKNPSYDAAKTDQWGYYKNDYANGGTEVVTPGEGYGFYMTSGTQYVHQGPRDITAASANDVDAWSLTGITSPLGKKIDITYEANTYSKSVYNKNTVLGVRSVENGVGSGQVVLRFTQRGLNIAELLPALSTVNVKALIISKVAGDYKAVDDIYEKNLSIVTIGSDYIVVNSPELRGLLVSGRYRLVDGVNKQVWPYFVSGAVVVTGNTTTNKFAGGIRTKSITQHHFGGHQSRTEYDYNSPGTSLSSGVTSFAPYSMVSVNFPKGVEFFDELLSNKMHQTEKWKILQYAAKFQKKLNESYEKALTFVREAPAPGACYEFVTVKDSYDGHVADVYSTHRFKVFSEDMVALTKQKYGSSGDDWYEVNLTNKSADIGSIVSTKNYSHDDVLLSESKFGYLYDDETEPYESALQNLKQGWIEQAFHKYIYLREYNTWDHGDPPSLIYSDRLAVIAKKIEQTNVLTSVEEKNYKTGVSSKNRNVAFDFFTGQPTSVISTDATGESFLTETLPAYRVAQYSGDGEDFLGHPIKGMGLKLRNKTNKHMLSQQAASYSYRLGANDAKVGLMSASVQTWSDETSVIGEVVRVPEGEMPQPIRGDWRASSSLIFVGVDGVALTDKGDYKMENFAYFNSWHESPLGTSPIPEGWQLKSRTTLYDINSNALEAKDMNGHYAATRVASDNMRVIASAANSRYHEFAYWGEEKPKFDGTFASNSSMKVHSTWINIRENNQLDPQNFHTGFSTLQVNANGKAISYSFTPEKSKTYVISIWSRNQNIAFGSNKALTFQKKVLGQAGGWYLIEAVFTTSAATQSSTEVWVQAGATATYLDDFRLSPYNATMTSFVYNQWGELSHILDSNNLFSRYEYDEMGRLITVSKETFSHGTVITSQQEYKYAGQQ